MTLIYLGTVQSETRVGGESPFGTKLFLSDDGVGPITLGPQVYCCRTTTQVDGAHQMNMLCDILSGGDSVVP